MLTRQQFLSDLTEEYQVAVMEEAAVKKQLDSKGTSEKMTLANGYEGSVSVRGNISPMNRTYFSGAEYLQIKYCEAVTKREIIERDRARGVIIRRLGWPAAMLTLIGLTGLSLYLVATNMLLLLAGWRALPSAQVELDLGTTSLSTLGVLGVVIEVLIIGYFLVSSIVGLYSLPPLKKILPVKRS